MKLEKFKKSSKKILRERKNIIITEIKKKLRILVGEKKIWSRKREELVKF